MRLLLLILAALPSWGAGCSGYGTALPGQFQTLSAATIAIPLSRVPVLITVTNNALKTTGNGGLSQSTGFDIAFSDDANTVCTSAQLANSPFGAHQIVKYDGTAGTWTGMVELSGMSAYGPVNALLWIGKASVSDLSSTNVWPTAYKQVHHLQENAGNASCAVNAVPSAALFKDATSGAHNSNGTGSKCPTAVTGLIGTAQSFVAANSQVIQFPNGLTTGKSFTMSAWVNGVTSGSSKVIFDNRNASSTGAVIALLSTGFAETYITDVGVLDGATNLAGAWHHIAGGSDGTKKIWLYVDGTLIGTSTAGTTNNGFVTGVADVGTYPPTPQAWMNGIVQEARLSNVLRSASDIAAEFASMTPATFFSLSNRVWGGAM